MDVSASPYLSCDERNVRSRRAARERSFALRGDAVFHAAANPARRGRGCRRAHGKTLAGPPDSNQRRSFRRKIAVAGIDTGLCRGRRCDAPWYDIEPDRLARAPLSLPKRFDLGVFLIEDAVD